MKKDFLSQLDLAISLAPEDTPEQGKLRDRLKKERKNGYWTGRLRTGKELNESLSLNGMLEFKIGPTCYKIFNNKQTLISFRNRVNRYYPKNKK